MEKVISSSFNITDIPELGKRSKREINYSMSRDLAYLRSKFKRMLHNEKGQGKTLHLIASDNDKTIIDIDSFLEDENWRDEIIEVLRSFKKDMESFGLEFVKIEIKTAHPPRWFPSL